MNDDLRTVLEGYDYSLLQLLAAFQGYKNKGKVSKAEYVGLLQAQLSNPNQLARTLLQLAPVELEALYALQRQGGHASRGAIRRRLLDLNLVEERESRESGYMRQNPDHHKAGSRYLDEVFSRLVVSGLVFPNRAQKPGGFAVNLTLRMEAAYFIPPVILRQLPAAPELDIRLVSELPAPAQVRESSARVFQRDLFLYWSYVHRSQPELIAKGLLAKRHLTTLNDTLLQRETIGTGKTESNFPRLVFLRAMLTQLGLIESKDGQLCSKPAEEFFGLAPHERIRRSFEAYIRGVNYNELSAQDDQAITGQVLLPVPPRFVDARKALMLHFRQASGWVSLDSLIRHVRETDYEFFTPRTYSSYEMDFYYQPSNPYSQTTNPYGWEWAFSGSLDEGEGWRRVEANLIAWIVNNPLHWMGLADVGFSDPKAVEADCFRLTAPGSWLLAKGQPPDIPVGGGQVIVQPDFTILAFDPVSDLVLFRLERFAQRVTGDRAIVHRLTQKSVYAAQQQGWGAARIRAYLEELSGQPLPGNVARTLEDWQATHERIRIYTHVDLLHASRPADLDELATHSKVRPLLEQQPAPGVVILPGHKKPGEIFKLLVDAGWWPVITPRAAELPARSVEAQVDGRLRLVLRSANIYLRAHLARFAEPDGDDFRLTPAAIRRAAAAGLSAPQVVKELNRVLLRPLPLVLEQRVTAWSGHLGTVQAEEVILLHFKNTGVVTELRRDPALADMLRPLPVAGPTEYALARPKDVEKLRRLLEERGVEWKEK